MDVPNTIMIKLQTVEVVSVTTAFLLKVVVELRRLPRFPAKTTLVRSRACTT